MYNNYCHLNNGIDMVNDQDERVQNMYNGNRHSSVHTIYW